MSDRRVHQVRALASCLALSCLLSGCDLSVWDWIDVFFGDGKDICFLRRWPSRCEGDVLVACPGGWMTIDAKMHRTDCRATDQYCVAVDMGWGREPYCSDSKGDCDVTTFSSYCEPYGDAYGSMTVCERGKIFATGAQCRLPSPVRGESESATPLAPDQR